MDYSLLTLIAGLIILMRTLLVRSILSRVSTATRTATMFLCTLVERASLTVLEVLILETTVIRAGLILDTARTERTSQCIDSLQD